MSGKPQSAGGKAVVRKYGKEYMRQLGRRGAQSLHSKYKYVPCHINDFALVERTTDRVVAFLSGAPVEKNQTIHDLR